MSSRGKKLSARVLHEDVDGETGKTLKFNPVEGEGAAEPNPNRRIVRRETLPQEAAIRRACGDVLVGVGSVLGLGARARVKFFIFYFSRIGYAPYHLKKRKKQLNRNRVRARTPSPASLFF